MQSRRLPQEMQLTRGRPRVAIATLDPDSALRRTVGVSVGIDIAHPNGCFGIFCLDVEIEKNEDTKIRAKIRAKIPKIRRRYQFC